MFVGVAGFEPTTSSSRTTHATWLRYTPKTSQLFITFFCTAKVKNITISSKIFRCFIFSHKEKKKSNSILTHRTLILSVIFFPRLRIVINLILLSSSFSPDGSDGFSMSEAVPAFFIYTVNPRLKPGAIYGWIPNGIYLFFSYLPGKLPLLRILPVVWFVKRLV